MKKPTDIGFNRTGISLSPIDSKLVIEGAVAGTPNPVTMPNELTEFRATFSRESEPVGTMPPPASLKGIATAMVDKLKGETPTVLLDLLGERLAFERTGTRLYEALLIKFDAASAQHTLRGGPTVEELERFRDDELRHFALLKRALTELGADPTTVTPSADIMAVASKGLVQVLTDPRTTLTQALHALLTAELVDNDGWLVLADLADRLGHDNLAADFRTALVEEEEHLARVRAWLAAALYGQAGIEQVGTLPTEPTPA
ncbi:MAG TPA: ferritin-like domain-containing protein [Polyangia bacterium]|jgi:rubrerythrin|nr:ferritin-like domain-containing protein [Polyangia bacterium]